jgi:hypothetical protein
MKSSSPSSPTKSNKQQNLSAKPQPSKRGVKKSKGSSRVHLDFNVDPPMPDRTRKRNIDVSRNEPFPIHVDLTDEDADFDRSKPGGIFTKHIYDPKNQHIIDEVIEKERVRQKKGRDVDPIICGSTLMEINHLIDSENTTSVIKTQSDDQKVEGFIRTEKQNRDHYRLARQKQDLF